MQTKIYQTIATNYYFPELSNGNNVSPKSNEAENTQTQLENLMRMNRQNIQFVALNDYPEV